MDMRQKRDVSVGSVKLAHLKGNESEILVSIEEGLYIFLVLLGEDRAGGINEYSAAL